MMWRCQKASALIKAWTVINAIVDVIDEEGSLNAVIQITASKAKVALNSCTNAAYSVGREAAMEFGQVCYVQPLRLSVVVRASTVKGTNL